MEEQDQKAEPYTFQDGDLTLRKVPHRSGVSEARTEQRLGGPLRA